MKVSIEISKTEDLDKIKKFFKEDIYDFSTDTMIILKTKVEYSDGECDGYECTLVDIKFRERPNPKEVFNLGIFIGTIFNLTL